MNDKNCIHFDGNECRNCLSNYFESSGESCIDCNYIEKGE